jgi:hypothetical protein
MRFLFVYQDFAEAARRLLEQLAVDDVVLIIARKNEDAPTKEELAQLTANPAAAAAACQVNRKYVKSVAGLVTLAYQAKKFRADDQQLRGWLVPVAVVLVEPDAPSHAFLKVTGQAASSLVIVPDALEHADEIEKHRWGFATKSAGLLAKYAAGEIAGSLRNSKSDHGVEFAANGRVAFRYTVRLGSHGHSGRCEWHLKEGDNTTRESAARVYFDRIEIGGRILVVVFYVGPHPDDGEHRVDITVP